MSTLELAPDLLYRRSKRGLVLAAPTGATVLLEHPRAHDLPALLAGAPTRAELAARLGPPLQPSAIDDLVALGILRDASAPLGGQSPSRRVTVGRSGILIPGIGVPSQWLDRHVVPVLISVPGRLALLAMVVAGIACFALGAPPGPQPSAGPASQALLLMVAGLATTVLHELAHAVALVHFGRTPRRAGFGFYWGALSFFVDSTPAMTLPRRERVVQALVGLAMDVVSTAAVVVLAHAHLSPLLTVVLWQRAVLDAVAIVMNALPVLEVDGHWALADLLDEPELAPRARGALAELVRGRQPSAGYAMAAYGAVSLLAGLGLLALCAAVNWQVLGDLIVALFTGNLADILIGVYLVGPLVLGIVVSSFGLVLESVVTAEPEPAPVST